MPSHGSGVKSFNLLKQEVTDMENGFISKFPKVLEDGLRASGLCSLLGMKTAEELFVLSASTLTKRCTHETDPNNLVIISKAGWLGKLFPRHLGGVTIYGDGRCLHIQYVPERSRITKLVTPAAPILINATLATGEYRGIKGAFAKDVQEKIAKPIRNSFVKGAARLDIRRLLSRHFTFS